jgi:hypothetical protein
MNTITNLKEIKELKYGDIVIFSVNKQILKYKVKNNFLSNYEFNKELYNSEIFKVLEIDKKEITGKAYGYKIDSGDWPTSKINDYSALTRLVKKLYTIIEEKETKYTKYNKFEIMDI